MPFSIDSAAVNVPSYPSHAVEANPANTVEMRSRWRYLRVDEVIERTTTVAVSRLAKPRRWLGLLCASTPDYLPGAIPRVPTVAAISALQNTAPPIGRRHCSSWGESRG